MKTGIELIAIERQRQIEVEEWSSKHDDKHAPGVLAKAAVSYTNETLAIFGDKDFRRVKPPCHPWSWPFVPAWWKPSDDPLRNLVKAGALIAAEIDRLQRANISDDFCETRPKDTRP